MSRATECLPNAGCYLARRVIPSCVERYGCALRHTMNRAPLMTNIQHAATRIDKAGRVARDVLAAIDGIKRIDSLP